MGFVPTKQHHGAKKKSKRAAHAGVRLEKLRVDDGNDVGDNGDGDDHSDASARGLGVAELAPTFAYEEVPDEVLVGTDIDLSVWSVVARDSCMLRLGGRHHPTDGGPVLGSSPNQLAEALEAAAASMATTRGATPAAIQRLNLQGAEHITDQALRAIASLCPHLTSLNVDRAAQLSDAGVRHLVGACSRLESLRLGFLPSLRGVALSAMAECQLPLRELSLAGCLGVLDFALQRVFLACGATLERLDLSFCDDSVTDATLLALSRHCGATARLRALRLRGCHQVSDAGVVHVAGACANLALLDLTRVDLTYKLNDIALLALADKCALLQTLQLGGCDALTDVGVSWLAGGCQALTHLDLSGCAKLSDLALRAVGDNLLQLRHLSLSNCARVSDLGLRHVALGCPDLAFLDASGLVLLSDARVAGLAKLRHLDLSRCASIGDATLEALASVHDGHPLAALHLAGCSRVSSRGVHAVLARVGAQLTALSLQGCDRVDDRAFGAVGPRPLLLLLPRLAVLRLRHCAALTDAAVRAIASANAPLRDLDLSGCARLTDVAVLALTESLGVRAALRRLWLRELPGVSETALAWLAARCPKLLLLDLTGCVQIRAFSLQALASSWRFAVYARGFKGLRPIHRADDRLVVEEYGDCWRAATRLQSLFRARVARREAARRRETRLRHWVATRLQSVYRGRQARRLAVLRRLQFDRETHAATRIQRRHRQRLACTEAERRRRQRDEARRQQAARCVQAAWRRKRLRARSNARALRRLAERQRGAHAATRLQRLWRGKRARDRVDVLRAAKQLRDREQSDAASKMQHVFRMRAARRDANARREQRKQQQQREERAALLVQTHVRRRHAQRELARRRREQQRLDDAARSIQRRWRRNKRDGGAQLVALARQRRREYEAAVTLQAAWKRKQGRDAAKVLQLVRLAQRQREHDAAARLQTSWRRKCEQRRAWQARQAALDGVARRLRLEHRSAALVQAHFRGRRGRAQFRALVVERKRRRWKEIVHPDSGRPFFYNKETGEVRFRRPQDVLDLLPPPPCDNCVPPALSIAHVECRDCSEFFCHACWGHVHAGGRRKTHAFRALYDFDGKRVDYGDGEFPSRWPSELQQDDMDGWALRAFPLRAPVETRGAWEKYATESAAGGGWWFYNKETEANSYAPPPHWHDDDNGGDTPPCFFFAAAGAQAEQLRGGWARYVDEASGYAYYYNAATGESSYERPAQFLTPRDAACVERSADGWAKYADAATGAAYYYHAASGESTYARPASFLTPRRGQAPVESSWRGDGWAKYFDDAQRVYYYYNAWTRRATFERPPRFETPRVDDAISGGGRRALFVDAATQRTYAFDAQTTECRAASSASSHYRGEWVEWVAQSSAGRSDLRCTGATT